ncbi:MAG: metallophosphoesterase family protein [Planctomycetota bacterium]|jgi:exonuclease SbcD
MDKKKAARILFLADSHLGFDYPFRPRIRRRRRGPDFFSNFERALEPALGKKVDLVIHGGDLLYRSKVPAKLVAMSFDPLLRVADAGVPVFVVPGNHERGAIPYPLLAGHRNLHIFNKPRVFELDIKGFRLALAGFPYDSSGIRKSFMGVLKKTGWRSTESDARLLCMHHIVEGARVGPKNYTFRNAPDVIRGTDIPKSLAAVLSGHIHRRQTLISDLSGKKLAAPVVYPGSIERTSFAEKDEEKGYMVLEIEPTEDGAGSLKKQTFKKLPARAMIDLDVNVSGLDLEPLKRKIRMLLASVDPEAVVRLKIRGELGSEALGALGSAALREAAPETMNVTVSGADRFWKATGGK